MSSRIHYKSHDQRGGFKAAAFEGGSIPVGNLKRLIASAEGCEPSQLELSSALTNEVFADGSAVLQHNTRVKFRLAQAPDAGAAAAAQLEAQMGQAVAAEAAQQQQAGAGASGLTQASSETVSVEAAMMRALVANTASTSSSAAFCSARIASASSFSAPVTA